MGIHFCGHVQTKQNNMAFKVVLSAALLAAAIAAPAPDHPAPAAYAPGPILPPVYAYQYGVNDGYSGAVFSQQESRDNYEAAGSYSVKLPDGRVQTVTYSVNGPDGGYVADVKYEGEASYAPVAAPAYKPAPAPAYKPAPAPVYKPAPAPVYKPAPEPVYKPKPAPVYHAAPVYHPAPVAAPSYKTYSFRTLEAEAAPAEEDRSGRVDSDIEIPVGNTIEEEIILEEIDAPIEEVVAIIEDAAVAFEEPAAPVEEAAAPVEEAAVPVEEAIAEIEALEIAEEEAGSTKETPAAAPVQEVPARFRFFRRFLSTNRFDLFSP